MQQDEALDAHCWLVLPRVHQMSNDLVAKRLLANPKNCQSDLAQVYLECAYSLGSSILYRDDRTSSEWTIMPKDEFIVAMCEYQYMHPVVHGHVSAVAEAPPPSESLDDEVHTVCENNATSVSPACQEATAKSSDASYAQGEVPMNETREEYAINKAHEGSLAVLAQGRTSQGDVSQNATPSSQKMTSKERRGKRIEPKRAMLVSADSGTMSHHHQNPVERRKQ